MNRRCLQVLLMVTVSCASCGPRCVGLGDEYFAKEDGAECCDGLRAVSREDGIWKGTTPYPGTDYPPGCGPTGAPPDLMVCLACGDGACGDDENYCNCPDDCAAPE
jgi:hypothetical protein